MKAFSFVALLLCMGSHLFAQQVVNGRVIDQHGPLQGATIRIKSANITSFTDETGQFVLRVQPGSHTLSISFVGHKTLDTTILVTNGQQVQLPAIKLASNMELNQVKITGIYNSGERKAISMRRNATAIMDVASADAIGKLPDMNAAEAVQRIPGVSIDRDQGEGRYVTVRGTPSQWSSTTINGDRMPAAKTSGDLLGNRTVPMDLLPSEFIQYVQVIKAITPDYEGDAIGGTINFIPRTSPDKRTLKLTAALPYSPRPEDKVGINGTVLYGDRLLKNKLGFLVLGNINRRTYGTDDYEVVYGNKLHNVTTLDVRNYQGTRTNKGFNAAVDYQISPATKVYARGYYTELLDNERNRKTMHYFDKATNNAVLRWNVVDYWFKNYGGDAGFQSRINNKLTLNGHVGYYKSWAGYKGPNSVDKNRRGYYYGNWVQTVKYGNMASVEGKSYKFLNGDGPAGYVGDQPDNIQPHFDPSTPYIPDNYALDRFVISIRNISEADKVGALDATYTVSSKLKFKVGGKYRRKTSTYDYRYITWIYKTTAAKAYITQWEREDFPAKNWFPELNNAYDNLKFRYPTMQSFINPTSIPGVAQNLTYTMNDATNSSYATGNYNAHENVLAGYGMTEWNFAPNLTFVGGLRYEYTDVQSDSYQFNDITKVVTPISSKNNFPAILPMGHLIYKPNNKLDLRAAATRTFARASFNEISPSTRVNPNTLAVTIGNPGLKPTFSWNYDVIGSYYLNSNSYVSAGLFYKHIKDVIYVNSYQETRTVDGVTSTYNVSQPLNSDKSKLYGIEMTYNQKFTQLPGFLSGLGLNLNYTYTKSETTLKDRPGEKIGLMNQSPNIFNAALFYEKYNFSLRVAANYRQAFLVEVRDNKGADRYQDQDFRVDLNLSYTLPKNITLFFDASNLTNQPLRYYHGVKSRPEQVEYYSARGRVGINWSL
ncbi:TonB-dependent receptor [Chitinophaga skermanii]|uniref:TonB-dependent receptor n=1 Tax=Chitinophaga skermanii TaxID=331697 RepID=A0A327QYT5_9BACT|nr:TonB-dependent receptor [Chitinophaga skermanii]RAJ08874.1 TonB-dependent receptor [Chitinophaga skermanii]